MRGAGPFTYEEELSGPSGQRVIWRSRPHRKGNDLITMRLQQRLTAPEGVLWAPHRLGWWIGVLFMIGSACFAVASLPLMADAIGGHGCAVVYFVGSIFFTAAGYLQFLQAVNVERAAEPGVTHSRLRPFAVETRRIDWWACGIQSIGTLCFNVSTFAAMVSGLSWRSEELWVWMPDVVGSVCFLVASYLAATEVGWAPRVKAGEWWICQLNWIGSIAFGISAVAAFVIPGSAQLLSPEGAALWTLVGAVCFLVGAYLLLPEAAEAERTRPAPAAPAPALSG